MASGLVGLGGCAAGGAGEAWALRDRRVADPPAGVVALAAETRTPAGGRAAAVPDVMSLELRRRGGYLMADAVVNGTDVGPMLLDTGASLGVIGRGVARRLDLPASGRGRTVGVGGFEDFDFVEVNDVTLVPPRRGARGAAAPMTLPPAASSRRAALDLRRFGSAIGSGLAGIVGFNELAGTPFTLDYAGRRLTTYRPSAFRPPAGAERFRLKRFRGLPLVRADIRTSRGPVGVWLLIDTGADRALTLPDTLLTDHPRLAATKFTGRTETLGVGGTVGSVQTWLGRIRVFGRDLEGLPVSFEPPPPTLSGGPDGDHLGRVGHGLLRHLTLTFDAPRGWVYAKWDDAEGAGG